MIYSIEGKIVRRGDNFVVVDAHGLGFKLFMSERSLRNLPGLHERAMLFTHLQPREDAMELYGFVSEAELEFFEMLISVSGVGPKSALAILGITDLKSLAAAIKENRPDLLTRASGIGRRTAERIIVELKSKVEAKGSGETVKKMEHDIDIVEALVDLGYRREDAKVAVSKVDEKVKNLEERLKATLKILGGKRA